MALWDKRSKAQKFMDDIDPAVSVLMNAGCPKIEAYQIVFQSMATHVLVVDPDLSELCVRYVNNNTDHLLKVYQETKEG